MKIALMCIIITIAIPAVIYGTTYVVDAIKYDYRKSAIAECMFKYFQKTTFCKNNEPCLTFNQFLSFFNVAPERWTIKTQYDAGKCCLCYYADTNEDYYFHFTTYGEQLKFIRWSEQRQKHKKVITTAQMMSGFIDSVRRDSKRAEQKAIDEAQKLHTEIEKRLEVQKGEEK